MQIISNFKPFWFDGNQWFGFVDTPKKAKDLLKYYNYEEIRRARCVGKKFDSKLVARFGFYNEYRGDLTLGQWIDKNDQKLFYNFVNKHTVLVILLTVGAIMVISILASFGII